MITTPARPGVPPAPTTFERLRREAIDRFRDSQAALNQVAEDDHDALIACLDGILLLLQLPSRDAIMLCELRGRVQLASFERQRIAH